MRKYYVNGVEKTKMEYVNILSEVLKDWDVYYYETVYNQAIVEFEDFKFQCKWFA